MSDPIKIIGSAELRGALPMIGDGVVGYCRVSSEQETRQTLSTEAQADTIQAYCHLHSLGTPTIITERKSAKNLRGRPELLRILAMVRAGQIKHLVVCEITRLSRDLGDTRAMFDELDRCGVTLHGATRAIDLTTADGSFVTHLDALLGEHERKRIGERVKAALAKKQRVPFNPKDNPAMRWYAVKGRWLGGTPRLGWQWVKRLRDGRLKIVGCEEHPIEMKMIRRLFELRRGGATYPAISRILKDEGYRRRNRFRGKVSGDWYNQRDLQDIVTDPLYWESVNPPENPDARDGSTSA